MKGMMRADPNEVLNTIKALRDDHELENALRDSLHELKTARNQINRLKLQIAKSKPKQQSKLVAQYIDAAN